jgi:hypothetical protein
MGKGSGRRNEDAEKVRDNWDAIWKPKDKPEEKKEQDDDKK